MKSGRQAGFTLLELMLSLAIVGLVSLIMFAGLQVASKAWESGDREMEAQQRLRILITNLFEEIKSSYNLLIRVENKTFLLFRGTSTSMDFVSTADSISSTFFSTGLKLVSLSVSSGGSGPQGLIVRESSLDNTEDDPFESDIEGITYSLAPDVIDLRIRYFAYPPAGLNQDEETTGEWYDSWGGNVEEVQSSGDAAELDLETYMLQYSNMHLPSGIELTIRMTNPQNAQEELDIPPIYISLQDCAVHSLLEQNRAFQTGSQAQPAQPAESR